MELDLAEVKEKFGNMEASASGENDRGDGSKSGEGETEGANLRPELDKNMVISAKSLREYRFQKPGQRERQASALEKSAEIIGDDSQNGGEGLYVDEICNQENFECLTKSIKKATEAAEQGLVKQSIRQQVLSKLEAAMELATGSTVKK